MTPVVRLVFFLIALLCLSNVAFSQTETRNDGQTESATVSGKVTLKGKPADRILVLLRNNEQLGNPYENAPRANTDQSGLYRIGDVKPGSYQISIMAPGYVIGSSPDTRTRTLVISAGENIENINFSIVRGGVITGRVTDSEGRPIVEERVFAYRAEAFNQTQRRGPIPQSGGATTDDRGIYRMFGMAAGQYKIAVGRGNDTPTGSMAVGRASYQQSFHPNVSDQTRATVVEVSEGSEATGVDITVGLLLQTYSAAGRVVESEKFQSVPNLRFGLQRIRGEQMVDFVNMLVSTNTNGEFLVEGLLPGKYRAFAMQEPNAGMRVDPVDFEVVDHDVTGIMIKVSKGAGISGVVVIENEDRRLQTKLSQLHIGAYVQGPSGLPGMGQSASSTVSPDGSFNIAGLPPGSAHLNVSMRAGPEPRWYIARIERDGVVQRTIEVKEGEQVGGVRVVVNYGSATLRGVVTLSNGEAIRAGAVNIQLSKPGSGEPNAFNMRPPQVDARGHFVAQGIPAGVYDLVVSVSQPGMKPRFQRQQVSLQDNTTTEVSVIVDMSVEPKP